MRFFYHQRILVAAFMLFSSVFIACSEDESTQSSKPKICFSVSGFDVTVFNMWKGGGTYTTNVQGLSSFTVTTSQNGETHTLEWTNIQNNYTTYTVDSFQVKIDGANYGYPANKCQ